MKYVINIGILKTLLIGLMVFQTCFLYLTDNASSLHIDDSTSTILRQSPISPLNHTSTNHLLGLFELEEEDDCLESDFLFEENHLQEFCSNYLASHQLLFFAEEAHDSLFAPPIYLVDEQFRL